MEIYLAGMKSLAGSHKSWGAGGKCRDSCRSAELEAENYKFQEMRQGSYEYNI